MSFFIISSCGYTTGNGYHYSTFDWPSQKKAEPHSDSAAAVVAFVVVLAAVVVAAVAVSVALAAAAVAAVAVVGASTLVESPLPVGFE